jgi:hypothetical protein
VAVEAALAPAHPSAPNCAFTQRQRQRNAAERGGHLAVSKPAQSDAVVAIVDQPARSTRPRCTPHRAYLAMKRADMNRLTFLTFSTGVLAALLLVACGGGGGGSGASPGVAATGTAGAASAGSVSTGAVTALGVNSVAVDGATFATSHTAVIDDDTGPQSAGVAALDVGMTVSVLAAPGSTTTAPVASEVHLRPLARGIVDASDTTAGTLTVMGQTVQLTTSTNVTDHRACVTATTAPCTAITGQTGLTSTAGSGSTAIAGNYVTVHGYLYGSGAADGTANIVATLVSVADAPTVAVPAAYKAEGVATVTAGGVSIGGLAVNLGSATCYAAGAVAPCASAFSSGQVVSVFAATAPALPATSFNATTALLRTKMLVATAGTAIELEGKVSSVTTAPVGFNVSGVSVDASALPAGSLPATGDIVRVLGTVGSTGSTVTATAVTVLRPAIGASYGLEGNVGSVVAGSSANTYVLTLLGQTLAVNANTWLADRSTAGTGRSAQQSNPFNISTFQSYLAASPSQHLLVRALADGGGNLTAVSVTIAPTSSEASISGTADASPAPVNSSATGTPSTFSVHGLAVSADPAVVVQARNGRSVLATTIAAGDLVLARGTYAGSTLSVTAPATTLTPAAGNIVIDAGPPRGNDHGCF